MIFIRSFAKPKSRKDAVGFAKDVSYELYAAAAAIKRSKFDFDLFIRVQYESSRVRTATQLRVSLSHESHPIVQNVLNKVLENYVAFPRNH